MTYEEMLNRSNHFSMADFIRISKERLPSQYRAYPWLQVNHGVDLLTTEEQLCAYIAAYGEMHHIKCRAAFQNFNFDSIGTNIEIIDWGCGQGIGALTFIDMLCERDKLHLLRKVTLIEPSKAALRRATINMQKATNCSILVMPINKYLPGYGMADEVEGVDYTQGNIVHIFSNILDILSVNLEKLACIVGTSNRTHYIMCMGPKNTNSYRIEKFCSAFNVEKDSYMSCIDNPCYGRTSDTNHNFSCITRCFKYGGEGIYLNNMMQFVEPTLISGIPIYDDYDPMLAVQNGIVPENVANLYAYLGTKLSTIDHVYLKPIINGDTPDIVVLRPNTGIMVIKVFDDDFNEYSFSAGDNGKIDYHSITNGKTVCSSPIVTVQSYQHNLIQLHIRDMLGKSLINKSYWSVIRTMVYFPRNTTTEIKRKFENVKVGYTVMLGKDIMDNADLDVFEAARFKNKSGFFDESICNSFLRIISPKWHSYKQGRHINLTTPQKRLAKSESLPRRKINGVAGSGKTQVLATRAVNANLRTGNRVLVLTFNLSLVNYIKYRIGQVRADFSWDMFLIVNYHQLFISEANNNGLKMNLASFQDVSFFDSVASNIRKYSTILVDEVQDYQTEWLNILEKYFLEPGGEFVVFGDAKQNIYNRELDHNGQIRIGFIPGEWNNSLNTGFRFSNPQLASLATRFQEAFFPSATIDVILNEQSLAFDTNIKYSNIGKSVDPKTLARYCSGVMSKFNIESKDVVVLAQTCDILRDIDYYYRSNTGCDTMTTFETKEQLDQLKRVHNIKDENSPITFKFSNDIKQIRRNRKMHFSMDVAFLKLSTIHSYKGWESSTVILILEPEWNGEEKQYIVRTQENTEGLIYTAITRCKENLFIINCGNEKYHNFFNEFCNNKYDDSIILA